MRSSDLNTLEDGTMTSAPALEELILNNTVIDDDAAPYISACTDLRTLEVAGTKFTRQISSRCCSLYGIDLWF
jgi:hypothetical protein